MSNILKGFALAVGLPAAALAAPLQVTVAAPPDSPAAAAFEAGLAADVRLADPAAPAPVAGAVYIEDADGADLRALADAMPLGSLLIINDCAAPVGPDDLPGFAGDLAIAPPGCDSAALREAAIAALEHEADQVATHLAGAGFVLHPRRGAATGLVISALPTETVLRMTGAEVILATEVEADPAQVVPVAAGVAIPPRRAGLPEPSIIVGDLARLLSPQRRGPLGLGFADREAMRALDPERFAQMLDSGRFDPEPEQILFALQTELQRMNCYSGAIDGDWGAGSAAALGRYFQVIGAAQAATTADTTTFRTIARNPPAECPAVAVAQPSRTQPAGNTTSRPRPQTASTGTTQRAPSASPPQPAVTPAPQPPQPAAPERPRFGTTFGGAGMFR